MTRELYHFAEGAIEIEPSWEAVSLVAFTRQVAGHDGSIVVSSAPHDKPPLETLQAQQDGLMRRLRRYRSVVTPRLMDAPAGAAMASWEFLHTDMGMTRMTEVVVPSGDRKITFAATAPVAVADVVHEELMTILHSLKLRRR